MAWLPLTEYANKFGISISTLRRRIRSRAITYKVEDGKYLVLEEEGEPDFDEQRSSTDARFETQHPVPSSGGSHPFFHDAQKMLEEIKKAYALILQEKEEQIFQLKDEISDLRTLVRVLETENERLKK